MLLFGRGPPPHKLKERRKCRPAFRVQPQLRNRLRGGEFRQKLRLLPGILGLLAQFLDNLREVVPRHVGRRGERRRNPLSRNQTHENRLPERLNHLSLQPVKTRVTEELLPVLRGMAIPICLFKTDRSQIPGDHEERLLLRVSPASRGKEIPWILYRQQPLRLNHRVLTGDPFAARRHKKIDPAAARIRDTTAGRHRRPNRDNP